MLTVRNGLIRTPNPEIKPLRWLFDLLMKTYTHITVKIPSSSRCWMSIERTAALAPRHARLQKSTPAAACSAYPHVCGLSSSTSFLFGRVVGRTLTYAYMYPDALAVCCLFGPASSIRQQLDQLDLSLAEAYLHMVVRGIDTTGDKQAFSRL